MVDEQASVIQRPFPSGAQRATRQLLLRTGLHVPVRWANRLLRLAFSPAAREVERRASGEFQTFAAQYGHVLRAQPPAPAGKRVMFVTVGRQGIQSELGLIKSVQMAGHRPVIVMGRDHWCEAYYDLIGAHETYFWDQYLPGADVEAAEVMLGSRSSLADLLDLEVEGVRVGRFAASTALRRLRVGELDLSALPVRQAVAQELARSIAAARAATAIVRDADPAAAVFVDRGYTPQGQLFDACLLRDVDVVTWNAGHRNNTLILKRYRLENRDEHPSSLSEGTWQAIQHVPWPVAHRAELLHEIGSAYASGEWFGEVGTQRGTRPLSRAEIRARLGVGEHRQLAVIFPHILWDGTFFWGSDLFRSYEEWLVETVRAAAHNDSVDWLIKVHPANTVKNVREGVTTEPAEVLAIRRAMASLPPHVRVIPASTDISTFSLFDAVDHCVTVRGTVGMEAAALGLPVLTAGTGRFDRRGFTIDSDTRDEYLDRLAHIQEIERLSAAQRELAERFAYGVFVARPLRLRTVTLSYDADALATPRTSITVHKPEDWTQAPDLHAFLEWLSSEAPDFVDHARLQPDSATAERAHGARLAP